MTRSDEAPSEMAGAQRWNMVRGSEGFFRAGQDAAGRWWLIAPDGAPFFLRAVHGVTGPAPQADGGVPADPAARLRKWHFNAAGLSAENVLRDDGLPFLASADFSRAGQMLVAPGLRLPDVFDPEWPRLAGEHALEVCTPLRDCRELIGWVTDDLLEWGTPSSAGRPSLLQLCLSLEPAFPAYHAAWEFVLAHHGGRLERVAQAWNAVLGNKEVVRELTRADEGLSTRGYLRDEVRWAREFARRYFQAASAALRQADPNHLVFGCRFRRSAGAGVLAACAYPAIDIAMPHWSELPAATTSLPQPVLADNVRWAAEDYLRLPAGGRPRRLTLIERMLRKSRDALDRIARHPAVIGYAWAQWQDEPGEQPPFAGGLVHANGTEAREHTELLEQFNARAEQLRRTG